MEQTHRQFTQIDGTNTQMVHIDRWNGTHSHLVAGFIWTWNPDISEVWKNLEPGESWNPQTLTNKMYLKPAELWYPAFPKTQRYLEPVYCIHPQPRGTQNAELPGVWRSLTPRDSCLWRNLVPRSTWNLKKPEMARLVIVLFAKVSCAILQFTLFKLFMN